MKTRKNKKNLEKEYLTKSLSIELVEKFLKNQSKLKPDISNKIKKHFINEFLKSIAYGPSIQTIELSDLLLKLN